MAAVDYAINYNINFLNNVLFANLRFFFKYINPYFDRTFVSKYEYACYSVYLIWNINA